MPAERIARPGNLKRLQGGKPDITDWTLESVDKLADLVRDKAMELASEAMSVVMDSGATTASFPHVWTDEDGRGDGHGDWEHPREVKPLDVYVSFGFTDTLEDPLYVFDLEACLLEEIGQCAEDGSFGVGLRRMMVKLRELADKIESALPDGE